jgi:2,3-diaminopropionate biosynthesis protein SbnB
MPSFTVVPGESVSRILNSSPKTVLRIVQDAYLAHEQGLSVNPDSHFLQVPALAGTRHIALLSYLGGEVDMIGMKWIGSFPGNVAHGLPRASAVLLLNDVATGYPLACLEAAGISAARTAASAAIAAATLVGTGEPVRAAFVGAGVIARTIADYLDAMGIPVVDVLVHDRDETSAGHLVRHLADRIGVRAGTGSLADALTRDLVVFATTAPTPYVPAGTALRPGQVLLNISLRDLAPELLLGANNVLDDVDHCLKAQTSPHLAEQLTGGRDFVNGTLGAALRGEVALDPAKPTVFSPFGLGILDLAVGRHVFTEAVRLGDTVDIPGFFGETTRW